MSVEILTREDAKWIADESAKQAVALFIETMGEGYFENTKPKPIADVNFTPEQLADYWHCHIETIRLKKRKGEIPFYQIGRKIIFKKSEIDKLTANPLSKKGR